MGIGMTSSPHYDERARSSVACEGLMYTADFIQHALASLYSEVLKIGIFLSDIGALGHKAVASPQLFRIDTKQEMKLHK
jgi:hypothetical protein